MIALAKASAKKQKKTKLESKSLQARDHRKQMAGEILREALDRYETKSGEKLRQLTGRGDLRRVSVAWAIWSFASVGSGWLAE